MNADLRSWNWLSFLRNDNGEFPEELQQKKHFRLEAYEVLKNRISHVHLKDLVLLTEKHMERLYSFFDMR